jgi:uncharacterized membrane protein YoaK (UPF0700 family)
MKPALRILLSFNAGFVDTAGYLTGMLFVAEMAIQNAAHCIHLGATPPSTLMTRNTTQMMIDVADWIRGLPADARTATIGRLQQMAKAVVSFAIGATVAALLFSTIHTWCCVVAPLVAGLAALAAKSITLGSASGGNNGRPVSAK